MNIAYRNDAIHRAILEAGERMASNETLSPFARNVVALAIDVNQWHASCHCLVGSVRTIARWE
jgi:hypothetical protein